VKKGWRLSPGYYQPFSKGLRHELAGTSSLLDSVPTEQFIVSNYIFY
jgi:hypothetical protein